MALFNRKKSQTISELEDYYANRNNSTGRAWVMALLSLLITVAVLTALFFGVRWLYRSLTNDDVKVVTTTTSSNENETTLPTVVPSTDVATNSEPNGVVSDEAAVTTNPSGHSDSATHATNTPVAAATTPATTTPRTGDSTAELPKTGATSLFGILAVMTLAGYTLSLKRLSRK